MGSRAGCRFLQRARWFFVDAAGGGRDKKAGRPSIQGRKARGATLFERARTQIARSAQAVNAGKASTPSGSQGVPFSAAAPGRSFAVPRKRTSSQWSASLGTGATVTLSVHSRCRSFCSKAPSGIREIEARGHSLLSAFSPEKPAITPRIQDFSSLPALYFVILQSNIRLVNRWACRTFRPLRPWRPGRFS